MTKRTQSWLGVVVFVSYIYGTLGLARDVIRSLARMGISLWVEWGLFVLFGAAVLWGAWFRYQLRQWRHYAAFLLLAIIYVLVAKLWVRHATERIHFVEYGILTMLVFRSFRMDLRGLPTYPATVVLVGAIGVMDEFLQKLIPSRVYDPKDMLINVLSSVLAVCVIGLVLDGRMGSPIASRSSIFRKGV